MRCSPVGSRLRGGTSALVDRIQHSEPEPLRTFNRSVPRDLETICLKAMSKTPEQRYQTAQEMAEDLERFLNHHPILARPASLIQRTRKWMRRHRNESILGAVCLIFAVGLAAMALLTPPSVDQPEREIDPPPLTAPVLTRRVQLQTSPSKARVAVVPLDEYSGVTIDEEVIRPKETTPLELDLKPGTYLVVVDIPGYGFHEVYRYVPESLEEGIGLRQLPWEWKENREGGIDWPTITINDYSFLTSSMVFLPGGEMTLGGDVPMARTPFECSVESFYLDPVEVNYGDYDGVVLRQPGAMLREIADPVPESPVRYLTWDAAVAYAELVGKRLPTEPEYEFAATNRGTTLYPWGDDPNLVTEWNFEPLDPETHDRTQGATPIFGLYSSVAEWMDSRPLAYKYLLRQNPQIPPISAVRLPSSDLVPVSRTIRGGNQSVVDGTPNLEELRATNARFRVGTSTYAVYLPGVGFRCALSAKPRFLSDAE